MLFVIEKQSLFMYLESVFVAVVVVVSPIHYILIFVKTITNIKVHGLTVEKQLFLDVLVL